MPIAAVSPLKTKIHTHDGVLGMPTLGLSAPAQPGRRRPGRASHRLPFQAPAAVIVSLAPAPASVSRLQLLGL